MIRLLPFILLGLLFSSMACATTFKIATLSPDGSEWIKIMKAGMKEIEKKTNGRVKFKLYPGGVMGDDKAVMRKIRIRQLQGGAVTVGSISSVYPDALVYGLPMLFNNLEEVSYVRSKLDAEIIRNLEKRGFVSFGLAEGGFAYIMSHYPVADVASLRKYKTWIPASDKVSEEAIKAYDIQPVPLPLGDVLTGLQTGLIDTIGAPAIATLALHWHTQVKYLTDMPLLYTYALMIIDRRAFNKVSKQDQKVVRDILGRVFRELDAKNRDDNVKALQVLRQQHIEFIKPDENQLAEWHRYSLKAKQHLLKQKVISPEMMNKVDKYLQEYRSQH